MAGDIWARSIMVRATAPALALCMFLHAASVAAQEQPEAPVAAKVAQVVQELAEAYVAAMPEAQILRRFETGGRPAATRAYTERFFQGFTGPNDRTYGLLELWGDAYRAGQQFWFANPYRRDEVMTGYGYHLVTVTGKWNEGFENSRLTLDAGQKVFEFNAPERPYCWVSFLADARTAISLASPERISNVPVEVTGYLSPAGRYGHMGMAECEIWITQLNRLQR